MTIQRSRPFHETIVEAILECSRDPLCGQLRVILKLIKKTMIPKNHDKIIEAVMEYFNYFGEDVRFRWKGEIDEVVSHLLEQKRRASVSDEFGDVLQADSDGELPPVPDPDLVTLRERVAGIERVFGDAEQVGSSDGFNWDDFDSRMQAEQREKLPHDEDCY